MSTKSPTVTDEDDADTERCSACGEIEYTTHQHAILVWNASRSVQDDMRAGLYRIKSGTYCLQPMIGMGHIIRRNLEYICRLPPGIDTDGYPAGHLCTDCQAVVRADKAAHGEHTARRRIVLFRKREPWYTKLRYDQPIKYRVGTLVRNSRGETYLVVGHNHTGPIGHSPGVYGVQVKRRRFALYWKWLGPESGLKSAEVTT
jgi:hypothetical protein